MGSGATQPGLPERLLNEGHGRAGRRAGGQEGGWEGGEGSGEQERRNMKALSSHFSSLRLPQLLFSPPLAPLRNHFSLSLIPPITPNHSRCPPPHPPSLAVSRRSSFPLFSIHTNDSVKQVKCYKIPPEAQPA